MLANLENCKRSKIIVFCGKEGCKFKRSDENR